MALSAQAVDPFSDLPFSGRDFATIARVMDEDAGVTLGASKMTLVYSRLAKRVRALGLASFADYCTRLDDNAEERARVVEALVTHHTSFFREAHHFAFLEQKLAPRLIRRLREGGRVRLWSAGCSSGEEPYSIALTLLKVAAEIDPAFRLERSDLAILATDISPAVLAFARRGVYPAIRLAGLPEALRDRWMERDDNGDYALAANVRALVAFKQLNLFGQWPMRGRFDIIFCRNVMIYFDADRQARLERRFVESLAPEGHLCIGHSERIGPSAAAWLRPVGQTIYAARAGAA